jgi:hypothetical protein
VTAGLNYISKVSPLNLEFPATNTRSATLGKKKTITELAVKLRNSMGGKIGLTDEELFDIQYDLEYFDTPPEFLSKYVYEFMIPEYNEEVNVIVQQDTPFPMNIAAMIPNVKPVEEDI